MSEDELRDCTLDQLITLVRQLEARAAAVDEELAAARARVAELEAELAGRARRPPAKTSANSSRPPAQDCKATVGDAAEGGPKKGPPHGHAGTSRRRVEPDHIIACEPETCRHCGASLAGAPLRPMGRSQVVEWPPVRPVVLEAHRYEATCARCGTITAAAYPAGFEPTRVFGPRVEAVVCYLHEAHHVGYERVRAVLRELGQLALSPGAVANMLARGAQHLQPEVAAIREQVRGSPVIGSDETRARVRGQTWWQWVFQTPAASYHVIVPRRQGAVVEAFLDGMVVLGWVSDLYQPQLNAAARLHQICLTHQVRDLQYAIDAEASEWARGFQALLLAAIHLGHLRDAGEWDAAQVAAGIAMLEAWCSALLATPVTGREASRLWRRYCTHRDKLFVFLYHPEIPPTNNASERALRNSVIHRKVTGGFRSDWGAEAHAAFTTVLQTAQKQGAALLDSLQAHFGPPLVPPALPAPSPGR